MGHVAAPGIVTGLHGEAALAGKFLEQGDGAPVVLCHGPGAEAARKAAEELIASGVGGLISFGFAGGLEDGIEAGAIIVADEIRQGHIGVVTTDEVWGNRLANGVGAHVRIVRGAIGDSDEIVRTASDKTRLRYKTGALAADMESFAVGTAAHAAGLPFITIRAISDPALQSLPIMAVDAVGEDGKLRLWKIIWSLIRHPGQIGELSRLAKNTRAAGDALGTVCKLGQPNFGLPDYRGGLIRQLRGGGQSRS